MKKIIAIMLIAVMVVLCALPAFAADSKENGDKNVIVEIKDGQTQKGVVTKTVNPDGTITLTAEELTNGFTGWIIDGEYEIVSGSLTDKVIVIRLKDPNGTIKAVAAFDGEEISNPQKPPVNESPVTGVTVLPFAVLALIAMGAIVYSGKRILD